MKHYRSEAVPWVSWLSLVIAACKEVDPPNYEILARVDSGGTNLSSFAIIALLLQPTYLHTTLGFGGGGLGAWHSGFVVCNLWMLW